MLAAASRRHRIRFERRSAATDAYGNAEGAWEAVSTVWAGIDTRQKGRVEALAAGRLESAYGWRVTVLRSDLVTGLAAAWRGVIVAGPHAGAVFNVRTVEASPDNRELIMDVEAGVAV